MGLVWIMSRRSLRHLQSCLESIEEEKHELKVQNNETRSFVNPVVTREEFLPLRGQIEGMQQAQQSLRTQFQEVRAAFTDVHRQWQESQQALTAMQNLLWIHSVAF